MLVSLSEKDFSDFSKHTLLLPTFSAGRTGSFALDLLIYNYDFLKIGYLDIDYLHPVVASLDEQQLSDKAGIALPAEVYLKDNYVILQFRSTLVHGKRKQFLAQLQSFIEKYKFDNVVALSSLSIFARPDVEINASEVNNYAFYNDKFDQKKHKLSHFKDMKNVLHVDEKELDLIGCAGLTKDIYKLEPIKNIGFACFFNYARSALDFSGAISLAQSVSVALEMTKPGETALAFPAYWKAIQFSA